MNSPQEDQFFGRYTVHHTYILFEVHGACIGAVDVGMNGWMQENVFRRWNKKGVLHQKAHRRVHHEDARRQN